MALSSCSDDNDPKYVTGTYASSAAFLSPDSGTEYILKEGTGNNTFEVYNWSATDYGVATGKQYTLQLDLFDNDFESPVNLVTTTDTQARILVSEMNDAVIELGAAENEATKLKLRIVSKAYAGEDGILHLKDFPEVYSEYLELIVTPYAPPAPDFPATLYMIGQDVGSWNWESDDIVEMIPVWGKDGQFWCVRYFNAGTGFKWAPQRKWADDFCQLKNTTGFITGDGNAFVEADGMYMVFIDYLKGSIYIEPAKIYGIGDCFGGWNTDTYEGTISGNKVIFNTVGSGEMRLYAGSSYSTTDWWTREFIFFDGIISYRGNDGDQERVNVADGKKVTLDFNAGTAIVE